MNNKVTVKYLDDMYPTFVYKELAVKAKVNFPHTVSLRILTEQTVTDLGSSIEALVHWPIQISAVHKGLVNDSVLFIGDRLVPRVARSEVGVHCT